MCFPRCVGTKRRIFTSERYLTPYRNSIANGRLREFWWQFGVLQTWDDASSISPVCPRIFVSKLPIEKWGPGPTECHLHFDTDGFKKIPYHFNLACDRVRNMPFFEWPNWHLNKGREESPASIKFNMCLNSSKVHFLMFLKLLQFCGWRYFRSVQ